MRNILEKLVKWKIKGNLFWEVGLGEVRLEVEKETMMKIVGIQVRRRNIPQREDRGIEDPKTGKRLAHGKTWTKTSVDGEWPTKERSSER